MPFLDNILILYPQKIPENQIYFGVFKGETWEHWLELG